MQITTNDGLSHDDLKSLRKADTISFVRSPVVSYIAAIFHDDNHKEKARREITVEHCLKTYSDEKARWSQPLADVAICHYFLNCADSDDIWQSILSLLRPGDVLSLCWMRGAHTNGYMEKAGLVADRLDVIVNRKSRTLQFQLTVQTCESGSTARMIRRGAFNNQ